ncbi:unnamed protein product, partial [Meganyctiphanes norvegica]
SFSINDSQHKTTTLYRPNTLIDSSDTKSLSEPEHCQDTLKRICEEISTCKNNASDIIHIDHSRYHCDRIDTTEYSAVKQPPPSYSSSTLHSPSDSCSFSINDAQHKTTTLYRPNTLIDSSDTKSLSEPEHCQDTLKRICEEISTCKNNASDIIHIDHSYHCDRIDTTEYSAVKQPPPSYSSSTLHSPSDSHNKMEVNLQNELMYAVQEIESLIPQRKIETYSEDFIVKEKKTKYCVYEDYSFTKILQKSKKEVDYLDLNQQFEKNLLKKNENIIICKQKNSSKEPLTKNKSATDDNKSKSVNIKHCNEPTNIFKHNLLSTAVVYNDSVFDKIYIKKLRMKYNLKLASIKLSRIDEKFVLDGGISYMLQSTNKKGAKESVISASRKLRHVTKHNDNRNNMKKKTMVKNTKILKRLEMCLSYSKISKQYGHSTSYCNRPAKNRMKKKQPDKNNNLKSKRLASSFKRDKPKTKLGELHGYSNKHSSTFEAGKLPTLRVKLDQILEDTNEKTKKKCSKPDESFQDRYSLPPKTDGTSSSSLPPKTDGTSSSYYHFRSPSTSILPSLPLYQNTQVFNGFPYMNLPFNNLTPECLPPNGQPAPGFIKNSCKDEVKQQTSTMLEDKLRQEAMKMEIEAWRAWKKACDLQSEYWTKRNINENESVKFCHNCKKKMTTEYLNNYSNIENDSESTSEFVISEVMPNVDIKIEEPHIL